MALLKELTQHDFRARPFSRREYFFLAVVVLVGLVLRIAYQWDRPWYNDEVGTIRLIHKSYHYILTHFETWLTMHYFLVMTRFIAELLGEKLLWLGLVPMAAGIATIPLTARLASRFLNSELALAAAFLVAINPYLIQYSCTVRSYSLLVFFALLAIDRFFAWRDNPGCRQGALLGLISFFMLLFHVNGLYVVASLGLILLADILTRKDRAYTILALKTLLVPMSISLVFIILAYLPFARPMMQGGDMWHDTPPTGIAYLPYIFGEYFGLGFLGWIPAIFLFWGLAVSIRQGLPVMVLLPLIVLPVIFMSLQGLSHFPWAYGRFIIFTVPLLILFIVQGAAAMVESLHRKAPGFSLWAPVIILALVWSPGITDLFRYKKDYPWNQVADNLKERLRPGDSIICNDEMVSIHLEPYFTNPRFPGKTLKAFLLKNPGQEGDSIFFVSSGTGLVSSAPAIRNGKIQVYGYMGKRVDFMGMLRDDLENTLEKGEIDPGLANFYGHLYQLNESLGDRNDNMENFIKWQSSYLLTERVRNMPYNRLLQTLKSSEP